MYKVIKAFTDLRDGNYAYNEGDTYPREGAAACAERIEELSTTKNRRGIPLIEEAAVKAESSDDEKPKKKGRVKNADKPDAPDAAVREPE